MEKDKNFLTIYGKVLRYLAIRPRSLKEITDYLQKRVKVKQIIKEKIINQLDAEGLIDDENFAHWWLDQRAAFRPKGSLALTAELRQKGIERSVIEKILSKSLNEAGLAEAALTKKLKAYRRLPPPEFRQKALAFLQRRGFSWETAKSVVDELSQKR